MRPEGPSGGVVGRFLRDAAFENVLSPEIVEEVLRALAYPRVRKRLRAFVDAPLAVQDIIVLSDLVAGEYAVQGACADPDDDKYLAAAVEGRAAFVVSGDRALLAVTLYEGIRIVTPRTFLGLLPSSSGV